MFKRMLCLVCVFLMVSSTALAASFRPKTALQGKLDALDLLTSVHFYLDEKNDAHLKKVGLFRWNKPIHVYVDGNPTSKDLNFLDSFLMELSFRIPTLPPISRVSSKNSASIIMSFVPQRKMQSVTKVMTIPSDWWVAYHLNMENNVITNAIVVIATDVGTQNDRNFMILQGLAYDLGLTQKHTRYEDSVMYAGWKPVQKLSEVDWLMLNMIYSPLVKPGTSSQNVKKALEKEFKR